MDRHVNLRNARVLVALTALLLVGTLCMLLSCAQQGGGKVGSETVAESPLPADEEPEVATPARDGHDEADRADEGVDTESGRKGAVGDDAEPSDDSIAGAATDQAPQAEKEPPAIEPASLSAGDEVSAGDVERAGGVDAFFWTEPISDEVFARMEGKSFGADCTTPREDLRYLRVLHVDAEGHVKVGELVVHRKVADEVLEIFSQLYEAGYPIRKMHLVDDYDASDDASCADDNTSSFNYRLVAGTSELSNHAYGLAIDINPFENPYCIWSMDVISPDGSARFADRSLREPYMIHTDDLCYQLFVSHGWSWGGSWSGSVSDYQHFEKPDALWQ